MAKSEKYTVDRAAVDEYERLLGQLKAFYLEISTLSKKSPDGPMNKFKLRFINDSLKKATTLLNETCRPFPDFEEFSSDDLPTVSDVGMMLSQYLNSMKRYAMLHTHTVGGKKYWITISGGEVIEVQYHHPSK